MLQALLLFACKVALEATTWRPEKLERLEACREFCRSICTELGRTPRTQCLQNMWVLITMIKCRLGRLPGDNIDANGMAWPPVALGEPSELLKKLNPYKRRAFKQDIEIIQESPQA